MRPKRNLRDVDKEKEYEITQKGFTEFVSNYVESGKIDDWEHFYQQNYFVCINGKTEVDFLGRFENISKDWKYVCDKTGINSELPHEKNSGMKIEDYKKLYTEETRKIIYRKYKLDFELFNYSKNL